MIHQQTQITDRIPLAAVRPRSSAAALRRMENMRATAPTVKASREASEIAVRMLGESDATSIARLAGRDSADVPTGRTLGAEADGVLIAALALDTGAVVADPFRATASAVELLELRAAQLRGGHGRRRLRIRIPRLRRARGAIAGSPPGGGSNLLQL